MCILMLSAQMLSIHILGIVLFFFKNRPRDPPTDKTQKLKTQQSVDFQWFGLDKFNCYGGIRYEEKIIKP